jgi:hypothetical protein
MDFTVPVISFRSYRLHWTFKLRYLDCTNYCHPLSPTYPKIAINVSASFLTRIICVLFTVIRGAREPAHIGHGKSKQFRKLTFLSWTSATYNFYLVVVYPWSERVLSCAHLLKLCCFSGWIYTVHYTRTCVVWYVLYFSLRFLRHNRIVHLWKH